MAGRASSSGYGDIPMPTRWEGTPEFDWMGMARQALTSIMPETEMKIAARYLSKARFALFLSRLIDAIRKGRLSSHRRQIENLFSGRGEAFGEALEAAREGVMRGSTNRDELNNNVQRVKAAYALCEAHRTLSSAP